MSRLLKRMLNNVLTPAELEEFIAAFDIVGDIAIIKVPESLMPKSQTIAETLLSNLKYVKTVHRQSAPVSGQFRVRGLEHLAGEKRTQTLYKEYGCVYRVDLAKAFFSPRLSTERNRIADLVRDGEVIANLFSGVGPFSILIAKRKRNSTIHSIEVNPDAYSLMLDNISLNKANQQVVPYLGDAREIIARIEHLADRVIMPHPEESEKYIDIALRALKHDRGMVHYYVFTRHEPREEGRKLQTKIPFRSEILSCRKVREIAAGLNEVVVDLEVFKAAGK